MENQSVVKTVFPNGARLLLVSIPGVESVATSVMMNVGSRFERNNINGVSHFLEHMVFKGTQKYPTTEDVNFIERLGGLQNAYTDIDVTCFHNKVLAEDWKEGLEINKELSLYPRLEEVHVDKERDVILEEMKRYEDEPAAKVGELFHELLYPGTKLGMRIIGHEKSLRESTSETLKAYHDMWYQPERMVVVVAGKIDEKMRSAIDAYANMHIASLPAQKTEEEEVITNNQDAPRIAFVTKPDASQAHMTLGLRTFDRNSPDRFAWNVFNLLFGVSFTSRLFKEIREKKGLCYTIRSSSENWNDVGYWSIYAGVATEKIEEATTAILRELKKVAVEGVTQEEVNVAIKRLKTMLAFRREDPEFMNEWFGRQELYHQPILSIEDYRNRIEAVTSGDINAILSKYITEKTLNLAIVSNRSEDKNLVQLLTL